MEQDMRKSIRKTDQLQSFYVWLLSALPIGRFCKKLQTGLALETCRNERLYEFRGCAEKQTAVSHSSIEADIFPWMLDHLRKLTLLGMWLIPSRWKLWEATPTVFLHIRSYLRCTANAFTHSIYDVETSM